VRTDLHTHMPLLRPHAAGRFIRFRASGGGKFTKICHYLPWTPMKRRATCDAASFILGGKVRNHTNKRQTIYPHLAYRHAWIITQFNPGNHRPTLFTEHSVAVNVNHRPLQNPTVAGGPVRQQMRPHVHGLSRPRGLSITLAHHIAGPHYFHIGLCGDHIGSPSLPTPCRPLR